MDTWIRDSVYVIFIGYSMGAAIAANLAAMYNHRLQRLNSDDSLAYTSCSVVSCPPFLHADHRRQWQNLLPDHFDYFLWVVGHRAWSWVGGWMLADRK
jgi:pimeloyl-ACP methyl ester carboxylesterase